MLMYHCLFFFVISFIFLLISYYEQRLTNSTQSILNNQTDATNRSERQWTVWTFPLSVVIHFNLCVAKET